jgi:hypothetical protein
MVIANPTTKTINLLNLILELTQGGDQTKPYGEWQYTDIGKQFACFDRKEGLKWHPKVIDLIIENDPPFQQLRLAV